MEQTWNSDRNVLALRTHYKPICSLRFLLEVWFGRSDWVNDASLFSGHENSNLKISGDWWWNSWTVCKDQQCYPRDIMILNGWIYQEVPSGQWDWFKGGSQVSDEQQKIDQQISDPWKKKMGAKSRDTDSYFGLLSVVSGGPIVLKICRPGAIYPAEGSVTIADALPLWLELCLGHAVVRWLQAAVTQLPCWILDVTQATVDLPKPFVLPLLTYRHSCLHWGNSSC